MLQPRNFLISVLGLGLACGGDPPVEDTTDAGTTTGTTAPEPTTSDTPAGPSTSSSDTSTGPEACVNGEVACADGSAIVCEDGVFGAPVACAGECIEGVGCTVCTPGSSVCDGELVVACDADGQLGEVVTECDPVQGQSCAAGACTGACGADAARPAEAGCEFYAVPLPSEVASEGGFGVGLTNTCDTPAKLQIDLSGLALVMEELAPSETRFFELARVGPLLAANESVLLSNGSYRVRTDCPALAVQISGGPGLASVDASRLYPTDRWGEDARVVTRESTMFDDMSPPVQGYVVVSARDDGTTVSVEVPAGISVGPIQGIAADGSGEVVMNRGDTLLLIADLPHDLAGARVVADRPIGVFGGHECSMVPLGVGFCDHLEEVMPPQAALGGTYVVVPPVARDLGGGVAPHVIRVVGTQDGTTVTTSDDTLGGMVDAGGVLELGPISAPLEVSGDAPILVAQFHVGTKVDPLASDPAMLVPPPVDQFRDEHAFWTAEDWPVSVVDIVAPAGATATLDGVDVGGWAPIEGTDWVTAAVVIDAPGGHALTADMPVGVAVYGLKQSGSVTSYAYAGAWTLP